MDRTKKNKEPESAFAEFDPNESPNQIYVNILFCVYIQNTCELLGGAIVDLQNRLESCIRRFRVRHATRQLIILIMAI